MVGGTIRRMEMSDQGLQEVQEKRERPVVKAEWGREGLASREGKGELYTFNLGSIPIFKTLV